MRGHKEKVMKYIITAATAALFCLSSCSKENANVVKIALICPMTGDVAAMGQGMKRAAMMAVEEANSPARLPGITFKLDVFDDRADPKEAVNAANRIISDSRIFGVVGHLNSGCSIPASQIYARANLVMISPASTNPKVTLQGLRNVFRVCTTDDVQGSFAANYTLKQLKKDRVSVIHDKTAYGQGIAENFKRSFEEMGGRCLSFDGIDLGDKDFKALLTSIKGKKPGMIYFGGMYTECGLISKQAKELGLNVPVFSDDGSFTPEVVKVGGMATEGDYFSMVGIPPEKLQKAKDFMDRYKAKYPGQDMQPYDPYTYETTMILIDAVTKTNMDRTKLIDYIANMKYDGIIGRTSFDRNGDTLNKAISIYKVVNGKFIYAE
jgi:branched-chain amino acid transport system substrate-binding protein